MHALVAILVFGALSGSGIRGAPDPFGEGEVVEVMLTGREGARVTARAAAGSSRQATVAVLAQRLRATSGAPAASEISRPTPRTLDSLLKSADGGGRGRQGQGADAAGRSADQGSADAAARSSLLGDRGSSASAGDFIGQIDACWRALPLRSRTAVTLEVVINDKGRLATKPTILRAPGTPLDEARLTAEATALAAIQTCLPANKPPLSGLQKSYRLVFDPARRVR